MRVSTVMDMNRHLALTVAGAAAIIVTAASGAVAANVGILNAGASKPAGQLTAANVAELATPTATRVASTSSATTEPITDPSLIDPATGLLSSNGAGTSSGSSGLYWAESEEAGMPRLAGSAAGVGSSAGASPNAPRDGSVAPSPAPGAPTPTPPTTSPRPDHDDDDDHDDEDHDDDDDEDHKEDDDDD